MDVQDSIEDIEGLVRDLSVAEDNVHRCPRGRRSSLGDYLGVLHNSIHKLTQATNAVSSHVQIAIPLTKDADSTGCMSVAEACSLQSDIEKLEKVTCDIQIMRDVLRETMHHSVLLQLCSYGSWSAIIRDKVLPHFEEQIKDIIRDVLNDSGDDTLLWRVAEECYNQATKPFGTLDVEDYFAPLEEAQLQWPYDPDFESEEYYEHEDKLNVDEDYAIAFREREQRRFHARQQDREAWPDFWIAMLNKVPDGPTLFCPSPGFRMLSLNLEDVPRYLFRTFDRASSGKNDDSVVASVASVLMPNTSRSDLLAMDPPCAAQLLHQHLTKNCFEGGGSDNLMSWTSSLLFAVQYAIWRAKARHSSLADVHICAVDTRNFPTGQFVQDLCLLEAYRAAARDADREVGNFFRFRLETHDFYNGEYLSQGRLNHAGRSCVTTLEHLLKSGLGQLYPEFEDPRGGDQWTKRVLELRRNWSPEQITTDREMELALAVARECFTRFSSSEIASLLLTFKNRKLVGQESTGQSSNKPPKWAEKPEEVYRFWVATEDFHSYHRYPKVRVDRVFRQPQTALREIFS